MRFDKAVWLLDPRFDFLLPWFEREFAVSAEELLFVGSYHGSGRDRWRKLKLGNAADDRVVFLEPEDLNRRFAPMLGDESSCLLLPFTGAYLPETPQISCLISTGELAIQANNKWWQFRFFRQLSLRTPETWRLDRQRASDQLQPLLERCGKLLLKAAELSGGYQMATVTNQKEFEDYCAHWQPEGELLVSEYVPHSQSFAGMGVVKRDGTALWCGATEQVLYQDFAYEGLIFPPFATDAVLKELEQETLAVGERLGELGYFGYFNVDFILSKAGLYAVELNARFGFGTIFFACCCGPEFWRAAQGETERVCRAPGRLVLGKLKGRPGRVYNGLRSESDILSWFSRGEGGFRTFFCGTERAETFEYGSFIGLFGEFAAPDAGRDDVLRLFWDRCLRYY